MKPFFSIVFWVVSFYSMSFSVAQKDLKLIKVKEKSKPLIMQHADSLAVSNNTGQFLLFGNVRFIHDSTTVFTNRAIWNRKKDIVNCYGGFKVFNPKIKMRSKSGSYDKKNNIAIAQGDAVVRDSANGIALFGEKLIYNRDKEIVILPSKPVIQRYYSSNNKKSQPDTLEIKARYMEYVDSTKIAKAINSVEVIRGDLLVTCDTAFFNRDSNLLYLYGNPICRMSKHMLKGDFMRIELKEESLKSILVINNATGTQKSDGKKDMPGNYAEVHGDTLYAEFRSNDKMKVLKASVAIGENKDANGFFYEDDLKEYVNEMQGVAVDINFDKRGNMKEAIIKGQAKSKYWYVTNERNVEGQNEAYGDSIIIRFDGSQIDNLQIKGNVASGVFYEKEGSKGSSSVLKEKRKNLPKAASKGNVKIPRKPKVDPDDEKKK